MKVWSAIFNLFAVVIIAFLLILFYRTEEVNTRQFEELRLRYAVDYANEAAFRATIGVDDIGIDYTDMDNVQINPSLALETFKSIICLNYDMSMSEDNFRHIENSIPTGVLFTRNGYYVLDMVEVDTTPGTIAQGGDDVTGNQWQLQWTVKNPYKVKKGVYWYAVSINPTVDEKWTRVEKVTGLITDGKKFNDPISGLTGLNAREVKSVISRLVMEDLNYVISKRNYLNTNIDKMGRFYLPAAQSTTAINNVKRPTLMMFMQGVDFAGSSRLEASSVSGVMTSRKKVVVGFIENGIRYYCYEKQLPAGLLSTAEYFFNSMEEAAQDGYYPHLKYLAKPIDKKTGDENFND